MTCPLVRELAGDGIPVTVTCGVLGFSTQAFDKWRADPVSDRDRENAPLTNAIRDIHADDPEFGCRFIADELERAGHAAFERRVHRLCREHRVFSTTTKKGRTGSGKTPGPAVPDDLVQRNFTASRPDEIWLTGITEHPTSAGKLSCCAVKDLFSNRIVGDALSDRMTAELDASALRSAIGRRQPKGTVVVHSDRGSPVPLAGLPGRPHSAGLLGSMGRVAAAGDNAAMESCYSLLQKNVLDRHRWANRSELHYAVVTWIERTYNRRWRRRALGKLTPVEFELAFGQQVSLAA